MALSESLSYLKIVSDISCRFTHNVSFEEICINEVVGVTIEDSYENNQKVYTTTAIFQTCDKLPITKRHLSFRLTGIDGKRYMIGTNSRPFPIIKENNPYPEKVTDSSLKTVTITWKSMLPMLLIVD